MVNTLSSTSDTVSSLHSEMYTSVPRIGGIYYNELTLAQIVQDVSNRPGMAYFGRFKLSADLKPPSSSVYWFHGFIILQNPYGSQWGIDGQMFFLEGTNKIHIGYINGSDESDLTLSWVTQTIG